MPTYYHRLCDRAGRILRNEKVELPSLREAMAHANMRVRSLMIRDEHGQFDLSSRIEIADCDGHPVARIHCADVMAASAPTVYIQSQ